MMKSSSIDDDMDEDMNEEDEDGMENGLQALGLMGNVAYMNDDSFKCPVCGLKLDSQHTFTLHIRSHNPNDHSNTCSLCGKTLSSASSLDRHMLIHSGERPFKCSLCGMAFTTNGNMHRHMRTHGHGSIGYTPRGQKRRAKLLTQALEKAVAAAAAGEEVDYGAINKLKKSILESKVTVPTTTGGKRQSKNQQQQSAATTFSEQLLSSLAPNVSIEAAAAAAVAAAHNAAGSENGDSILSHLSAAAAAAANSQHQSGSGRKHRHRNSHSTMTTSHHQAAITPTTSKSNDKTVAKESTSTTTTSTSNLPLNLANNSIVSWPTNQHSTMNPTSTPPTTIPEKGRPGRKKKQRLSDPVSMNRMMNHHAHHPSSLPLSLQPSSTPATQVQIPQQPSTPTIAPPPTLPPTNHLSPFGPLKDRCPICAHPIRTMPELHLHMMAYHMQERLFCNDCGMILDNYDTYTHHRCTASAATVMSALRQNPNLQSDLLFCSSNTSRMNFSSARTYAANLELLRAGLTAAAVTNGGGGQQQQHNRDFDHEAFLGSEDEADEFDQLTPEESRSRLSIIVDKIDLNRDGNITETELKQWIQQSQKRYIYEDVDRQWQVHTDNDPTVRKLSWERFRNKTYGFLDEIGDNTNRKRTIDDMKTYHDMLRRDERRWSMADIDGDKALDHDEFISFLHPEESEKMYDVVVDETLEDVDHDGDGRISESEYISDMYSSEDNQLSSSSSASSSSNIPEWVQREREQFHTYRDKNGDGYLDREEIREWIVPANYDHADAEAKHLIYEADTNKDGILSLNEILDNYDVFVGSQATDFGDALTRHDEF